MATMKAKTPIKATCHCKAIAITVPHKPEFTNECQCSICRSYAAAWAYYTVGEVDIPKLKELKTYNRKDVKNAAHIFCWCGECGVMVCWWPVDGSDPKAEVGMNTRIWDPKDLERVERRVSYEDLEDDSRIVA